MENNGTKVIEGLHIDVEAAELSDLLMQRAAYHNKRVEYYETKVKELEKVEATMAEEAERINKMSNSSPRDEVRAARAEAQSHREKASSYKFLAAHVVVGATYRLGEHDLARYHLG